MSGICGIFNLDGAPIDPNALHRMAEAMAHRGPDGIRYWIGGNVGFAHLALNTTPESVHEQQPMSNPAATCWITADATIYNRDELIHALVAKGMILDNPTDTALLIASYEVWGVKSLKRLVGDFAFSLWDAGRQALFCARDPMGVRPFFYHFDGQCLVWASEIQPVLEGAHLACHVNDLMVAYFLVDGRAGEWEQTFYQGVNRLPHGQLLVVTAEGLQKEKYFDFDPDLEIHYACDKEYVEHFLELFTEAVRARLRSHYAVGVSLSGGLDSASIACMAAQLCSAHRGLAPALESFSCRFREIKEADERKYLHAVVEKCSLKPNYVDADGLWFFRDRANAYVAQEEPDAAAMTFPCHTMLRQAAGHGVHVMLSGHGGDHVLLGSPYHLPELLRDVELQRLARELRYYRLAGLTFGRIAFEAVVLPLIPGQIRTLIHRLRRKYARRCWISPRLVQLIGDHADNEPDRRRQRFRSVACRHVYETITSASFAKHSEWFDRAARPFAIEWRFPYLDTRLVQFLIAIPPIQKFRDGITKLILRRAMDGILPELVRRRTGWATFGDLIRRGHQNERLTIEKLLTNPRIGTLGYVDADTLKSEWRRSLGQESTVAGNLHRAVVLERWLRSVLMTSGQE